MDDLFKVAVGAIGLSTASFYNSTPREVELAIEGYREKQEIDFFYSQQSMINAVGIFFGGKGFKVVNPFAKQKKAEVITMEKKDNTFEYLHSKFKEEEGEE